MLVVANLGLRALICILRTLAGREGNPWAVGCAAAWSSGVEGAHIPGSSGDLCHTCPCRMYMCMYVETCQAALTATAETHKLLGENVSRPARTCNFLLLAPDYRSCQTHPTEDLCQAWARIEGDLHRALMSYMIKRARRNQDARCRAQEL